MELIADESRLSHLNPLDENSGTLRGFQNVSVRAQYRAHIPQRYATENHSGESALGINGNELAENEVKNVPTESKCSTVRKPLSLY